MRSNAEVSGPRGFSRRSGGMTGWAAALPCNIALFVQGGDSRSLASTDSERIGIFIQSFIECVDDNAGHFLSRIVVAEAVGKFVH